MKRGDVIIFPTDTVYGMGCKIYDKAAIAKIYELKERSVSKHLPILIGNLVDLNTIAQYDRKTLDIMTTFWPGALTIILKTRDELIKKTGEETIAVRIPDHYLALDLISEFGPLRATSVNISGQAPLNTYEEVLESFGSKVEHIYGEHVADYIDVASTIVDVSNGSIKLVREGVIPFSDILKVYNK